MTRTLLFALPFLLMSLYACTGAARPTPATGDTLTHESQLITIIDMGPYAVADIRNPWALPGSADTLLQRYILTPHDFNGPLPDGTVVRVPVTRSVVYSGVHGGAIDELGRISAISGVADAQYFTNPGIRAAINSGTITDIGNSMSPSVERIIDLNPEAILLSPMENDRTGIVEKLGIPVIQCVDYMESTPLGRAEWIKLLGILYGAAEEADSIYQNVADHYSDLWMRGALLSNRPTVLTEQPYNGTWNLPAGNSYMAHMLADAGCLYPWGHTDGAGSLKLDLAAVLDRAGNADFWLIRSYGDLTLAQLRQNIPLAPEFKAFKDGNVYICDTSTSPLFDEFPFHPEKLLHDYINIFHPGILVDPELHYFHRAQ